MKIQWHPVGACRLLCVGVCVCSCITTGCIINLTAVLAATACILTFFLSEADMGVPFTFTFGGTHSLLKVSSLPPKYNPYIRPRTLNSDDLTPVTYDDLEHSPSVESFNVIQINTECVFARSATIWGSDRWEPEQDIKQNIARNMDNFSQFVTLAAQNYPLDGFVFEVPHRLAESEKVFSHTVYHILSVISSYDPKGQRSVPPHPSQSTSPSSHNPLSSANSINRLGWVFQFNRMTFFVTTFAPYYKENHSRYAFGSTSGFILLQPEISFARHNLSPDTPLTAWHRPRTARDRTRVAYRDAGRAYRIRDTTRYPMAWDVVKSERDCGKTEGEEILVEWWNPQ